MALSGINFTMHQMIIDKLKKAAATSKEKAATIEEARFELEESQWLDYFAGIFLGKVKKYKRPSLLRLEISIHMRHVLWVWTILFNENLVS